MSNRHFSRILAFQILFEWDFNSSQENLESILESQLGESAYMSTDTEFIRGLVLGVSGNLKEIDEVISLNAPEWPIDQISGVDRSVLRLAVFELLHSKSVPPKVVINEAVELAKSFAGQTSGKFVNGVLGAIFKKYYPEV